MIRKIIKIDEVLCNGCGICVDACHEGAIGMVDGKAKLLRDDYCDGLGDCLPTCPTGAISFEEREAAAFDKEAVEANIKKKTTGPVNMGGCLGKNSHIIQREETAVSDTVQKVEPMQSQLQQWPVQIKLVPVNAPYFDNAHLLIAADCTAFAYADFHNRFMKKTVTLIGCPKLDNIDYSEKLTEILNCNNIRKVTVVRMEVPCCSGISTATITALQNSGKMIPWNIVTISTDGKILED